MHNPLPPCPGTPTCVRETRLFSTDPDTLLHQSRTALQDMGVVDLDVDAEQRSLAAVFRVVFFKDDVYIRIDPADEGSALHIRSASRTGRSDFGVNRRRVDRFFRTLPASATKSATR